MRSIQHTLEIQKVNISRFVNLLRNTTWMTFSSSFSKFCLTRSVFHTAVLIHSHHSPQQSNWHIVSHFKSYSAECESLMGLQHWGFIWISTQIPWSADVNKHTHTHRVIMQKQSLCTQICSKLFPFHCDVFHVSSECVTVHAAAVLWWLANGVMSATILRSKQNWLCNGPAAACSNGAKQDEIGGLQEMPSPYVLHWTATPLLLHFSWNEPFNVTSTALFFL